MSVLVRLRSTSGAVCAALIAALLSGGGAHAADTGPDTAWTVREAASQPAARLALDPATGALTFAVTRGGAQVVEPSPLGIVTERADLSRGLHLLGRDDRAVAGRYTTAAGKSRERVVRMHEARFRFAGDAGARLDVVVRAAADGVAYRYELPGDTGDVLRETSAFTLPDGAAAWLGKYRQDNENNFVTYPAAASAPAGDYMMQALFRTGGSYALIAESGLDGGYAGAHLAHAAGSPAYRVGLWQDDPVRAGAGTTTPWRAVVTGGLATVTESTFTDDLAPASRVRDTSWIKPGRALWSWLSGGREAGQSLEIQKGYADYAAERGWPYVTVDAGWYFKRDEWDVTDPDWPTDSWLPELVDYARARGVGIAVWVHYRDLDTAAERDLWLSTLERWGVKGMKIDFMNSEGQDILRWYDEILPATAAHHLMVDFHGSTIPKGIQRTWPQVMTLEGVNGEEKRTNTSEHLAVLPYTRNAIGSMDFTPGAFHRDTRPNTGSDASELGLSVLYESGIQNLSGSTGSYDARPVARRFLEQLPDAWDETRLLAGEPGKEAVMARRGGGRWFLGGYFAGAARTADVPLRLGAGPWLVETITDGPDGLVRTPRVVTGGGKLDVDVRADGGFAAVACRWSAGRTSCG